MDDRRPDIALSHEPGARRPGPKFLNRLRSDNPRLNGYLFVATCLTTFLTGYAGKASWQDGLWYSGGIMSILMAHEMGHYLMCRRYKIKATLPYFLPFIPVLNPFGTLGAVIRMESVIPNRKALFDVAVAGPLAGLALTIPALYFGIRFSEVVEVSAIDASGVWYLGESMMYTTISDWAVGALPENKDIMLHPLAFAGWAGLFVTALNLLPIGQLDGGHVIYALIGRNHGFVARAALVVFGYIAIFHYRGWALFLILLIWFGHRHPPTLDDTPIDRKRMIIGVLTMIIFFLSFTPEPFKF